MGVSIHPAINQADSSFPTFFFLIGDYLLDNIVVVFAIHSRESAMGLHVFPILNLPLTHLVLLYLYVYPKPQIKPNQKWHTYSERSLNRTQVFHNITKAYTGFYKCIEIIFRKDSKCLHWKLWESMAVWGS